MFNFLQILAIFPRSVKGGWIGGSWMVGRSLWFSTARQRWEQLLLFAKTSQREHQRQQYIPRVCSVLQWLKHSVEAIGAVVWGPNSRRRGCVQKEGGAGVQQVDIRISICSDQHVIGLPENAQ
jgi:hypothetical protein